MGKELMEQRDEVLYEYIKCVKTFIQNEPKFEYDKIGRGCTGGVCASAHPLCTYLGGVSG